MMIYHPARCIQTMCPRCMITQQKLIFGCCKRNLLVLAFGDDLIDLDQVRLDKKLPFG